MKNTHISLAQVRALVAIVDAGSFTDAALDLNITQSALSHAVSGLEKSLGIVLLERGRNGVSVTENGERVLLRARDMLRSLEGMRQEAAASRGITVGKLRIGSFTSTSARLLPKLLGMFRRHYPGVDVALFDGTDEEILHWLETRTIDTGFVTALSLAGFDVVPIADDQMQVLLPPDHPLMQRQSIQIEEIVDEPFIMSTGGCEPLITPLFSTQGVTPNIQYRVREVGTIVAMVREGLGISIVPEMALPQEPGNISICLVDPPAYRYLGLAVRSLDAASPVVRAFLEESKQVQRQEERDRDD